MALFNSGNKVIYYLAILASALLLMIPAFYNHYPIFNPDSGTYIGSGFELFTPDDRPIIYGLLIVLLSFNGLSAWLVVFFQALLVSWLIFQLMKIVVATDKHILFSLSAILILATCTSLSWVVCQLQPDLYTSVASMCVLLLFIQKGGWKGKLSYYIIFFLSVAVHMSHPFLFALLFICLFFIKQLFIARESIKSGSRQLIALLLISLSAISCMGFAFAQSKHVFLLGSFADKGILKLFLDENCGKKHYALCDYKEDIVADGNVFWWAANSPLYKIGGWQNSRAEGLPVVHDILTTPKYLWMFTEQTLVHAWRQALTFNIGDGNFVFKEGSGVRGQIKNYFPNDLAQFDHAIQNTTGFKTTSTWVDGLFTFIVSVSLLFVTGFSIFRWKLMSWKLRSVFVIFFAALIINFADCAALTVINGRYGCKIIWIIPLCAMMFIGSLLTNNRQVKSTVVA